MTPDPIGSKAVSLKDPTSWNKYAYVGGDPVNRSDPRGTDWVYDFSTGTWTQAFGELCWMNPSACAGLDPSVLSNDNGIPQSATALDVVMSTSMWQQYGQQTASYSTNGPAPGSPQCEQSLVQSTITTDASNLGINFAALGFSSPTAQIAGYGGVSQTELNFSGSPQALQNLLSNPAFQANFVNAGADPLHGNYNAGNWRQNVGQWSIQITADAAGNIQVDIDPNNPMFNPMGHAMDVLWNFLTGGDTNYNSVANALGINGIRCQ